MPLLAVSDFFFEDVWSKYHQDCLVFDSLARKLISWQHLTFLPLLMVAKFGIRLLLAFFNGLCIFPVIAKRDYLLIKFLR